MEKKLISGPILAHLAKIQDLKISFISFTFTNSKTLFHATIPSNYKQNL